MTKKELMFLGRLKESNEHVADTIRWAEGNMHSGDYMKLDSILYRIVTTFYKPAGKKHLGTKLLEFLNENRNETTLEQLHSLYEISEGRMPERMSVDADIRSLILKHYAKEEANEY
jgi:hypothetical protein